MPTEQRTITGDAEKCDELCSVLMTEGWELKSFAHIGEFFPKGVMTPTPFFAYVMVK